MSADNLAIWKSVEKTDPKYTKTFKRSGGFSGTATNATYLAKRATEVFGPCGLGWGVIVLDERLLDGADGVKIHRVHIELWYIVDGERGTIQHFGQTEFCGKRSNGNWYTDEEAPKKSLTDAMTKALSLLGFASDVHLGLFDDNKYVNNLRAEFSAVRPATPPNLTPEGEAERDRDWDKRQDQAYGKPTIPPEPIKDPGPGPITSGNILPIKSSAQAKRDGDWPRIEATLKEASEQQSFTALLAWPSQQSGLLSALKSSWIGEAEEAWRVAFLALLSTECHSAAEIKQFAIEYREAIGTMPPNYIQACREVVSESLGFHRKQRKQPAEDRMPA